MAAPASVVTIRRAAEILGEDEELLWNLAMEMEPEDGWSLKNLIMEKGTSVVDDFYDFFPSHKPLFYSEKSFNPGEYLYDADLAIVHEWNHPSVIKKIGDYKLMNKRLKLLFHDTHHRSLTKPEEMKNYDLVNYDGVLAFGEVIRKIYLRLGWAKKVWTWHEAADTHIFHPRTPEFIEGDVVWIGNWGDEERTEELKKYIINPVRELGLKASFYGVRYPSEALKLLRDSGIEYKGWIPNHRVPEIFSRYKLTVHVPRRPYVRQLPGIPTIRPFEALACGIPLICSPWNDKENLFSPGKDFLVAGSRQMKRSMLKIHARNSATGLT